MYKIMTKLHTVEGSIYRYYRVRNGQGKLVEYETDDIDEAVEVAKELLRRVGYLDLRVVDELPYYITIEKTEDRGIEEEDIEKVECLLGIVGYDDLYLSHDAKYDIIWNWGEKPEPVKETYTLTFVNDPIGSWEYAEIGNIEKGESRMNALTFEIPVISYHLIIDGNDCSTGLPEWVECIDGHTFKFNNIQENHEIEVVVDYYI